MRKALPVFAAAMTLASIASGQVVWIGPEIPVNAVTAGSQFAPSIATTNDGGFVVAWQGTDASGFGIRARRFNADGTPATGEIAVNSTTAGNQISPSVARFDDGRFAVAWASQGQDGSDFGIVARIFSANGAPSSAEIPVNSIHAGSQTAPKVATQPVGSDHPVLFVVWTGPNPVGDSNEIYARAFDSVLLAPLTADVRINQFVSGHQLSPALIRHSDGGFVVAWASEGQDGSGYGVFARRVSSEGGLLTGEIPVAEVTVLDQLSPALTQVSGSFAVAWQRSLQAGISEVGPQPVIAARVFNTLGQPLSDEIDITPDTSLRHERPALAAVDGGFLVAWRQSNPDPEHDDKDVFAAQFSAAGLPQSGEFRLNTTLTGDQIDPVLGSGLLPGRFTAAWASFGQDGSSFGVFAQRFGQPCEPCAADDTTLCFLDGRFRVRADFATAAGASGDAQAVALTDESGYFTFFDPENVELVVKAVDACGLAGFDNFWIFATGLTNVEVTMTAEDTLTCESRVYHNDLNHAFEPILDSTHFQVCGAGLSANASLGAPAKIALPPSIAAPRRASASTVAPLGGCAADEDTLCLLDGRFSVEIVWQTETGDGGPGVAFPLTDESGYFWFFTPENVELVVKMVDGCDYNDRYWIYAGGLTNLATRFTVRDTLHPNAIFEYVKPVGPAFPPIQTIEAFATCP